MGLAAVALLAVLSYMGTPRYAVLSSIDQEIVAELIPQTHPGPFRQSIWADFRAGEYEAAKWEEAPTPSLQNILHLMEEELEVARGKAERGLSEKEGALENGRGFIYIEDWQEGLRKVTFRVIWNEGPAGGAVCAPGSENEFCQTTYIHEDSNYRQGP